MEEQHHFLPGQPTPLGILETVFHEQDWPFRRHGEQGLYVETAGSWVNYRLYFSLDQKLQFLTVSASYELRVPSHRQSQLADLLLEINHNMTLGHFDLWTRDGAPTWRYALPLRGLYQVSREQLEDIVDHALVELERFYPAFQGVLWGGLAAKSAVKTAIMECQGMA